MINSNRERGVEKGDWLRATIDAKPAGNASARCLSPFSTVSQCGRPKKGTGTVGTTNRHGKIQRRRSQSPFSRHNPPRRGVVLVLVLVVVALLALACFTFSELMLTERKAADLAARRAKARAIADSGVEMARLFLSQEESLQLEAGGCYDNQQQFRGVIVSSDEQGGNLGRFTIVAPSADYAAIDGPRYGLEDESNRLNLNTLFSVGKKEPDTPDQAAMLNTFLGIQPDTTDMSDTSGERDVLMGLPGMTEDIADAILDWIDPDDEPRQFGAEADYYASLASPYAPKNGPLETVEELLLVRGVTPELLLGVDANRNAMVEPYESAGAGVVDSVEGSMDRGWSAYLTLHSAETNKRSDGSEKIDLNQADMEQLHLELEENLQNSQWAAFIVALRQYGPYGGSQGAPGSYPPGNTGRNGSSRSDATSSPYSTSPRGGRGDANDQEERLSSDISGRVSSDMSVEDLTALVEQLRDQLRSSGNQGSTDLDGDLSQKSASDLQQMATQLQSQLGSAGNTETEEALSEPFPEDFELDLSKEAKEEIQSVLDLIGAKVEVEVDDGDGAKKKVVYQSPFSEETKEIGTYLPILMEVLAADTSKKIVGRININQASPAVLRGIPGMTPETVDQILTGRQPDPLQADVTRRHATWILSEELVTLDEMKQLLPYVTGGGSVYRVQVIGYFDRGGPAVRVEAVLDATTSPVQLRQFRDLSHLGRGYALETLGIQ